MLLAIDLGNTETAVGVWDGSAWLAIWRRATNPAGEPEEFAVWLGKRRLEHGVSGHFRGAIIASVVPLSTEKVARAAAAFTDTQPIELKLNERLGIDVRYNPPDSLGADRLANALAAKAKFKLPVLTIDVGTATTFEAVDRSGAFVGGAIMPGPELSAAALAKGTAALPVAALNFPPSPIGGSTVHAIQSGIMLGHAAAIQGLAAQMVAELGDQTTVIATGGLGERFLSLCPILSGYYPTLTLDGLVIAHALLAR